MVSVADASAESDGNRLTYLDEFCDPYYAHRQFPRLITPQWVGDDGVLAVVTLGIDDMRSVDPYEKYLRPLLERLKKIDGRAPVSIMTNTVEPRQPHLQDWLTEGLSIETHTADHPCPCLKDSDFAKAKDTFDRCVDQIAAIPGNHPVAFRFPCCDSLNTPSPRAFAEIVNKTTAAGNFLQISSSVCCIHTANDADLPRDLVLDSQGQPRFTKYVPFPSFVNKVYDYPYPFVIGRLCWEFPITVPDDWQAQNLHRPFNPQTVEDLSAAIDAAVIKKGVANIVFHPYVWIRADQMEQLVDRTVKKHGAKVKFLNFRECLERLTQNLLAGQPLRDSDGADGGVRLLDVNHDGYLDVVIGNARMRRTRVWMPREAKWLETSFPVDIVQRSDEAGPVDAGVRFGVLSDNGNASFIVRNERIAGGWYFDDEKWVEDKTLLTGLEIDERPLFTSRASRDQGIRLRDLDNDGMCELIIGNSKDQAVFQRDVATKQWKSLAFSLPADTNIVDDAGQDAGLRFIDVDEDGRDDIVFSNEDRWSLHLSETMRIGWRESIAGKRSDEGAIPPITLSGANNGAWSANRHLWWKNENTHRLPDGVDRRSFNDLLGNRPARPKPPEVARRGIQVTEGYQLELAASEPQLADPVDFDWGPDGCLWVVEMADYPLGIDGHGTAGGRVRRLFDSDGDGRFDKSSVFLEGLNTPTGIMVWREGVLITAAPDVLYAEDSDGDGVADRREVLYTGFGQGNQQHRVNGLRWGLDNWVYLANGDSGGTVTSRETNAKLDIGGHDVRIRPDQGRIEAVAGKSQFGRNRDDWGNWFGCNNPNPIFHFVLANRYLGRNPHFAPPSPRRDIRDGDQLVFPISRDISHGDTRYRPIGAPTQFTSANSTIVYRDEYLGPQFAYNTFTSEPVYNLVHRRILAPHGVTFHSRRAANETASEFFRSNDPWCRPTAIHVGHDGALYVADMYRQVIEHPEWIDDQLEEQLDLRAGHDRGRIYRISPVGMTRRAPLQLDGLDTKNLVAALDSPNGPQRDLVQRMLIWRNDPAAVEPLQKMAKEHSRPLARLHALCALDGLTTADPECRDARHTALEAAILTALVDPHPGVRRHAVRIGERFLAESCGQREAVGGGLLKLVDDPDLHVQFQLAFSLGEWDDPRAAEVLGRLAAEHFANPYFKAAVMSSVNRKNIGQVATVLLRQLENNTPARPLVQDLLALAAAMGESHVMLNALDTIASTTKDKDATWQMSAVATLLATLNQKRDKLDEQLNEEIRAHIDKALALARQSIGDNTAPIAERLAAVRALGHSAACNPEDIERLRLLLGPQHPLSLQTGIVAALAATVDSQVPHFLIAGWTSHSPSLRSQILETLLRRDEWSKELLQLVKSGSIAGQCLSAVHRQRLLNHRNPTLKTLAHNILAERSDTRSESVLERFRDVLSLTGNPTLGKAVFAKRCASCHRLEEKGHAVGPDLAALTNRSPEALLIAILDPNRAVEDKFLGYEAFTVDGRIHAGILSAETATSITLTGPEGKQQVLLREQIEELHSSTRSFMPEGLEKDIRRQDLADIIAYVSGLSRISDERVAN